MVLHLRVVLTGSLQIPLPVYVAMAKLQTMSSLGGRMNIGRAS
jgi:hypothetical protein